MCFAKKYDPSGSSAALLGTGFLNGDTGLIAVFVVVITVVVILLVVLLFYCFCRERLNCCNKGKDYDGDDSIYTIDSRPAGNQGNRGTYFTNQNYNDDDSHRYIT